MANRGKGSPKKVSLHKGYEPSPRDLEIYTAICEGGTLRDVGKRHNLSHVSVRDVRDKVERWLAPKIQKEILSIKARQTTALESIYRDCMASWKRSLRGDVVEEGDAGETGYTKTKPLGDVAYVDRAMKALAEIRAIWNIEKHFDEMGQSALNPSGMPREDYQLKIAQAQLSEAQQLIAELKGQATE